MEKNKKILVGKNASPILSTLSDFEGMSIEKWHNFRQNLQIPDYFLFLAGVAKNPKKCPEARLRFGKELVFVQNFLPHSDNSVFRTRGYGNIYCLYEPEKLCRDDVVLEMSAIYQALPDDTIRLILSDGEHRKRACVDEMFVYLRKQRKLVDFAAEGVKPGLFEITFKNKSCGYFLKDRTYIVWASPVGIPDQVSGELVKGWIICDINCGVPAVLKDEQEKLKPLAVKEGDSVGLFIYHDDCLCFNGI